MREFNTKAIAFGSIMEFRKLLYAASTRVFRKACPQVHLLIESCDRMYEASQQRPKILDQLCAHTDGSGQFIDAMRRVCDAGEGNLWHTLPVVFSISLWHMAFDDTATYNVQHDCKASSFHLLTRARIHDRSG